MEKKMKKTKENNSKLLKVIDNTEISIKTKKEKEDQAYDAFNEKCKELIRGEVRQLFENAKIEKGLALYNFAFHLTSELIFDNMPIGRFQFALNRGVKESEQNYLDYLRDEYQIKAREVVNEDKPKTIN